jgi:hypothetical protein
MESGAEEKTGTFHPGNHHFQACIDDVQRLNIEIWNAFVGRYDNKKQKNVNLYLIMTNFSGKLTLFNKE